MRNALVTLAAVLSLHAAAGAQVVTDCGWIGSPANIVEPWEQHSRTFANGNIRVAWLDTGGEPVCCSSHLLVLSPSGNGSDGPVYRQCRVVSARAGEGFFAVDVPGITATYDPARGLLLSVPVGHWHPAMESGAPPIWERMDIRINQATGAVRYE
ncbi:MAG: hypothetical protein Kow0013_13100 [Pararhodobacter sp.]